MSIKLYNSRTRQIEPFSPLRPDHIRFYVCGPTVYDFAHVGNARPVVVFDVLFRLLQKTYPNVTYVRNITDIDDKIMKGALDKNIPIDQLTRETTKLYHQDMSALYALPPTHEPRATEHVPGMINLIETLIAKGFAYASHGHALFSVKKHVAYGSLSNRNSEELLAGARVEVAPYKQDAGDFVLWKPSTDDQPGWESPWGRGRPGWHIECSAMSHHFFEGTFDIHGGGIDLIFPHHENEVAQSCCAFDLPYMANVWMHNGHVTVDGEKMSKSLGNFLTVHDLLKKFPGEAIRLTLLSSHYRQPLDFSDESLSVSKSILDRFYQALSGYEDAQPTACLEVEEALFDDLNTPLAISHIHEKIKILNKTNDPKIASEIKAAGVLLGLFNQSSKSWFQGGSDGLSEEEIEALIQSRREARTNKDFKASDRIRDHLLSHSIVLEDTPQGTTWKRV